jgi:hypothetical protein
MADTKIENWTTPGSDSFTERLSDVENEGACVNCGDYVPEYRKHFMDHYALNGGEYGHYAAAYELGHSYAHNHASEDWSDAEGNLRRQWEQRRQGSWGDYADAIRFAWNSARRHR